MINEVMEMLMRGRNAITRKIANSPGLTAIFDEAVRTLNDNPISGCQDMRNPGSALHRFDSALRPMARAMLLLGPFIATATRIAVVRQGRADAGYMNDFFKFDSR